MIIEEEVEKFYYGNLVIENYPNLQSIIVKENSLKNLNSLKICNCEKLKSIETEDGEGENMNNGPLMNVNEVIIESILTICFLCFYLPNLQSFETGDYSFYETTSLSLSSRIFLLLFM